MALSIVRHDITRIEADAIVNSTNEQLVMGGLGVDASIHYAAGPKLQAALDEIGSCPVGSAVVTESFDMPTCRYIIHAVAPVYGDGSRKERQLLRKTYQSILQLASEKNCSSVAIPLLSAGANGYPRKEAYEIATSSIRGWLADHYATELDILLVLYDRDDVELSRSVDEFLHSYIPDSYPETHRKTLKQYYDYDLLDAERCEAPTAYAEENMRIRYAAGSALSNARPRAEHYSHVDLSFADMCEWWCRKKGLKKGQFFSASNITRATFSNMKHNPDRMPKKTTALACVIGLKLDIDQANDLLARAGMTFSKHFPIDRMVEQFIRNGVYDIDEINLALYDRDLAQLGYSKGE